MPLPFVPYSPPSNVGGPGFCRRGEVRWAVIALAIALASAASSSRATDLGTLHFTNCDLEDRRLSDVLEAQCATLEVPENYDEPEGRKITLRIGLGKSQASEPEADPVLFLAGGPGQSAVDAYPMIAGALSRIREKRNILLIDQRGTGESNTLKCVMPEADEAQPVLMESPDAQTKLAADCAASLKDKADVRQYTTTVAIKDFEAVREAIGAKQWNLIGGSYGTRAAQVYAHYYPQSIRSMILDGVVPAEHRLASGHARNLENALNGIFERCRKAPECKAQFGDPGAALEQLKAELQRSPREVSFRDPKTGEGKTQTLTYDALVAVVRLFAYAPESAALIPWALNEAINNRADVMMAQAQLVAGDLGESITYGMQWSVMCSEDLPDVEPDPLDAKTLLGTAFVVQAKAQCAGWPRGERPADFFAPMQSDIPTLLTSGEFDPVTPPSFGEQAAKGYTNGRHIVVKGRGHIVIGQGCMPRLAAEFVNDLKPKDLDTTCLDRFKPVPAFLNANGWTP
ncbi:alpha/beta hydrolase [Ahniella affigens]|uniref:Proline iminopeptidase n=1 Tax=Ahniella affigens TaxID=2021234 RepID=A0A2P1PY01_9GAMM|nr:alpha/beta fold hydrolase [Ahniella affigens]AVP99716.1 alpha/beta hydrolase [Ahniella affigens]